MSYFQATLFFKPEHFKTAIPVSITALLVKFTLNHSIASKLPQSSDIKFIDFWILFGLLLHFTIIFLLVLIEHLPDHPNEITFLGSEDHKTSSIKKKTPKKLAQKFARKVLPLIEIAFISLYFFIGFIIYCLDIS